MTVLFYEPSHTGHHYPYLARMLPAFVELPAKLTLLTTEKGRTSDEFEHYLSPFVDDLTVMTSCQEIPPHIKPVANAKFRALEAMRLTKALNPDHLMILYGDGIWQCLAARAMTFRKTFAPSVTVEGILYRGGFSYPDANSIQNGIKRQMFKRLLKAGVFDRLLLDDEYLYDYALAVQPTKPRTQVTLAANPVFLKPMQSQSSARSEIGLPTDGRIISLSGAIDARKGADLLVRAFIKAKQEGRVDAKLLLAGPHADEIRALLKSAEVSPYVDTGEVISMDRLLVGDEMFFVAAASDVVTAPYPNHSGRSSIILWAAAAGRPVVATDRGCIARVVQVEELGVTCRVTDTALFAASLADTLAKPWTEEDIKRSRAYAGYHDIENYQRINSMLLRKQLK